MSGVPLSRVQARRERLLELLPEHDWSIIKAGIAAGYSEKYAKKTLTRQIQKDAGFCRRILEKQQSTEATTQDERGKALHALDEIIDNPKTLPRDRIRAIEVKGKMCAWLSETRFLETPQRQRELDEQNQKQARQMAILWGQTARLPGEAIDAEWQSTRQSQDEPNVSQDENETYDDSA